MAFANAEHPHSADEQQRRRYHGKNLHIPARYRYPVHSKHAEFSIHLTMHQVRRLQKAAVDRPRVCTGM